VDGVAPLWERTSGGGRRPNVHPAYSKGGEKEGVAETAWSKRYERKNKEKQRLGWSRRKKAF